MVRLFNQQKISFKLSCVVGVALIALCVMGTIAVIAAGQIRQLGQSLRVESTEFLDRTSLFQNDKPLISLSFVDGEGSLTGYDPG